MTLGLKSERMDISKCWNRMLQEIKRNWGTFDYFAVTVTKWRRLNGDPDEDVSRQHCHVLFFGSYIDWLWLRLTWEYITGDSRSIDIQACKSLIYKASGLASYVVGQYVSNQDGEVRYHYSAGWCFKGFVLAWRGLISKYYKLYGYIDKVVLKRCIMIFDRYIENGYCVIINGDITKY